ncbi:MAG: nucleotidyl transferase AbiEii/AbiGii toxin family protein, partial [Ignavibacteria bacterium]|nr:nucleotidyl transferase AbiEii/AbiGii toxin family protein [Ignavibacteria bacterium]
MQDLQDLEIFEIEILELLNSIKVLDALFFGGGTMLRLCHNLNRFSIDLDFWLKKTEDAKTVFERIK